MAEYVAGSVTVAVIDVTERTTIRILLVDDELSFLKVAKECLEMQGGFQVETAVSVEEAVRKREEETFDAIICDYQLPTKDGLEFLKELRERDDDIPFIVFTGKGREEVAMKALKLGADQYLNKVGKPETVYGQLAYAVNKAVGRKKAYLRVRRREEKLKAIFSSSPDAVTVMDLSGNISECNQATADMLGYSSKDELIGRSSFALVAEKDREKVQENLKKLLEQGSIGNTEYNALAKDGHEFSAELSSSVIEDFSGRPVGLVAITRDITERKRMEEKVKLHSEHLEKLVEERTRELKQSQELLIKSERLAAIGRAAAMVGHDLRNPLQSIKVAADYIYDELSNLLSDPASQEMTSMLRCLIDAVDYANNTVSNLQDFASDRKPMFQKTDINATIRKTLSHVRAPENVKITTELGHIPEIEVDRNMLERIFLNLAVNGIQAMEEGGMLKISTRKVKGFVEVAFKDRGVGISNDNMEKVFKPFFTTKARGMGIGLTICRKLVDHHNGSIKVESKEGEGSTFTVELPI